MRRTITVCLVMILAAPAALYADMIETKTRGILNGKIVSQDANEVRFEDAKKNLIVVPRADVLFLEEQKDAPMKAARPGGGGLPFKDQLGIWKNRIVRKWHDIKFEAGKYYKKAYDFINAPLDRSGAQVKADALANSMDSLGKSLGQMSKNDKKRRDGMKMMTTGFVEHRDTSGTRHDSSSSSDSGGRFSSLD